MSIVAASRNSMNNYTSQYHPKATHSNTLFEIKGVRHMFFPDK